MSINNETIERIIRNQALLTQLILFNLALTSLIIRVLLSPIDGYYIDLGCFRSWFYTAAEYGIREFYQRIWCDYPPFNIFIFWVFGSLAKYLSLFGSPSLIYIIKLPSNLFDLATSYLIFRYLRRKIDDKWALMAATFYMFNPSAIFNSSIWGQYDAIYTFFIVLSLTAILDLRVKLSLVSYALAVLTKPQAVAFFPILLLFVLSKFDLKGIVTAFVSFLSTVVAVILPFRWSDPVSFIFNIYFGGYGQYRYTSLNALNLWALIGMNMQDTRQILPYLNYHTVGWILFAAAVIHILHHTKTDEKSISYSTFLAFFSFFMLLTRMHERYLFPAIALSLLALIYSRKLLPISIVITFTSLFNQAYALKFLNQKMFIPPADPLVYIFSSLNLFVFIYCYYLFVKRGNQILTGEEP